MRKFNWMIVFIGLGLRNSFHSESTSFWQRLSPIFHFHFVLSWFVSREAMANQNTINYRVGDCGFVTKIIRSLSDLSEEGKVQRLESVKRTLEEKLSLLQRLDGEILEGLKEEQEICNEIERSNDVKLYIQSYQLIESDWRRLVFLKEKLKEISISEERSISNSTILTWIVT